VSQALHKEYQRLLGSAPARRLSPAKMLESAFFSNKLVCLRHHCRPCARASLRARVQVDTLTFLEKLTLKDSAEKDAFFRRLNLTLDQLPRPLVERKVLPLIAAGLEFGSAPGGALLSLLHAARGLGQPRFSARVLPCVLRFFASPDRAMRVALLQNMEAYLEHVSQEQMEVLYEQLANGFADGTAFLRELTLKTMLLVAPRLSQRTLTVNLLKHLAKLQMDEEPAIRANTTICLGNIARYLGEAACKRVLLNAFTRALRDPFPPARSAGLQALQATIGSYDASEAALRVLPCVTPLTVDPDAAVRCAAFEVSDAFLAQLRKHHAQRSQPGGAEDAAAATRPLVGQSDKASVSGSLMGWAAGSVGALAAAIGAPSPDKPPPAPAAAPPAAAVRRPAAQSEWEMHEEEEEDRRAAQQEEAARARLSRLSVAPASRPAQAASSGSGDGWGGEEEPFEDMQPSTVPLQPQAPAAGHIGRPAAAPRPAASVPRPAPALKTLKLGGSKLKGGDLDLEALLAD